MVPRTGHPLGALVSHCLASLPLYLGKGKVTLVTLGSLALG